jgi:hypothetical protein
MPTIVDFPTIVKDALEIFGDLFANAPARQHFAEYLTGLMVAERKNGSRTWPLRLMFRGFSQSVCKV